MTFAKRTPTKVNAKECHDVKLIMIHVYSIATCCKANLHTKKFNARLGIGSRLSKHKLFIK